MQRAILWMMIPTVSLLLLGACGCQQDAPQDTDQVSAGGAPPPPDAEEVEGLPEEEDTEQAPDESKPKPSDANGEDGVFRAEVKIESPPPPPEEPKKKDKPAPSKPPAPKPADGRMTIDQARAAIVAIKGRLELDEEGRVVKVFLNRTFCTDQNLRPLRYLPEVRVLNLTGTQVTDKGIEHLTGLTKLERLYPARTRITAAGIKRLKEALPNLRVMK